MYLKTLNAENVVWNGYRKWYNINDPDNALAG